MTASASQPELRLRWILPVVLLFSLWVNYQIVSAGALDIDEFAPLILRPARFANYGRDAAQLAFPAVNPALYNEVLQDQSNAAPSGSIGAIAPTGQATPTSAGSQTSTPPAGVGGGISTALPAVGEVVNEVLNEVLPELVPPVIAPVLDEIVPAVVEPVNNIVPILPTAICILGIRC